MPVFVKGYKRAGRSVRGYSRKSLVKQVKATANKFAPQKTIDALKEKYNTAYRFMDKRDFSPGYQFNGFVRRTRARALGKKTSIYG